LIVALCSPIARRFVRPFGLNASPQSRMNTEFFGTFLFAVLFAPKRVVQKLFSSDKKSTYYSPKIHLTNGRFMRYPAAAKKD